MLEQEQGAVGVRLAYLFRKVQQGSFAACSAGTGTIQGYARAGVGDTARLLDLHQVGAVGAVGAGCERLADVGWTERQRLAAEPMVARRLGVRFERQPRMSAVSSRDFLFLYVAPARRATLLR